jgi:hypothetical protein
MFGGLDQSNNIGEVARCTVHKHVGYEDEIWEGSLESRHQLVQDAASELEEGIAIISQFIGTKTTHSL